MAEAWFAQAAEYWKQAITLTPGNYIEAHNWLTITRRFAPLFCPSLAEEELRGFKKYADSALRELLRWFLQEQRKRSAFEQCGKTKAKMDELSNIVGLSELKTQLRKWAKGMLLDERRRAKHWNLKNSTYGISWKSWNSKTIVHGSSSSREIA
ncbi:hypothetical protein ISN44_As13g010860 [Arabidopsis suecica]|uniref:Uncharacterized protein n=1 Tax=Arabidopsis suecica TaxID=45249 RepID=A0A8T1XR76_ARASU|nr:hypothetical protein ISN44_As13g010860 [Arabidopsis suecica]